MDFCLAIIFQRPGLPGEPLLYEKMPSVFLGFSSPSQVFHGYYCGDPAAHDVYIVVPLTLLRRVNRIVQSESDPHSNADG